MAELLVVDSMPPLVALEHSFGGLPVAPVDSRFAWPRCRTCRGPMQFLGRLRIPETPKLVLLFMCQNDPGFCDDWDANAGGNCAIVVQDGELTEVQVPASGITVRQTSYGAHVVTWPSDDYDAAREAWTRETGHKRRDVLGQIRGKPAWIQADETPTCDACGKLMQFLAQLEQGPEWQTEMNFGGGGCAYVFDCACAADTAKLLWQC